jgi:uncharacterized protein YndB with AHSA1/START domain
MAKVYTSSLIAAPVERVWEYIRDFNGLPKWFPGVTDSHIEAGMNSGQVGCVRNFGLGGPRIREQLLSISDHDHACTYKMLEGPMPLSNYQATVRLSPADGNGTLAEITSQFDCSPEHENELVTLLGNTYKGAFELVKKNFGNT